MLFLLALLVMVFCAGGYLGQETYEPRVVVDQQIQTVDRVVEKVVYKPVEKVVETVVYEPVEKIVYEPVEKIVYETVEKIVYEPVENIVVERVEVPLSLRYFQNRDELEGWLVNTKVIGIQFNVVNEETGEDVEKFDCDDYAIRLQERALNDGYIMSFEVIGDSEYNELFQQNRIPKGVFHAINSVIIGNEVYYIEPQNNEIVMAAYID